MSRMYLVPVVEITDDGIYTNPQIAQIELPDDTFYALNIAMKSWFYQTNDPNELMAYQSNIIEYNGEMVFSPKTKNEYNSQFLMGKPIPLNHFLLKK